MKSEDEIRAQFEYLNRCLIRNKDCCKGRWTDMEEHTKECDLSRGHLLSNVP